MGFVQVENTTRERRIASIVCIKNMDTNAEPDSTVRWRVLFSQQQVKFMCVFFFINFRLVIWMLKFRTNSTLLIARKLTANSILVS